MKHKHFDVIVAWAEGKHIQWNNNGVWHNLIDDRPCWFKDTEYRIKPEPKPDVVRDGLVTRCNGYIAISTTDHYNNLRMIFDGETGALKSAEVLK